VTGEASAPTGDSTAPGRGQGLRPATTSRGRRTGPTQLAMALASARTVSGPEPLPVDRLLPPMIILAGRAQSRRGLGRLISASTPRCSLRRYLSSLPSITWILPCRATKSRLALPTHDVVTRTPLVARF